jgi:translation initiation factor 4A
MKVKAHACTGSILIKEEIRILKEGVHIVVGTPGRILDLIKKGFINTENLKLFVLDEADEMYSRGLKS